MKRVFLFIFTIATCAFSDRVIAQDCSGREIHLSFDDGPQVGTTDKILNVLNRFDVKGTFFVNTHLVNTGQVEESEIPERLYERNYLIGTAENEKRRQLLREISDSGHAIGSHGYEHMSFLPHDEAYPGKSLNTEKQGRQNIRFADRVLGDLKTRPKLFRLPYGKPFSSSQKAERENVLNSLEKAGVNYNLQWDYDSRDWEEDKEYESLDPQSPKAQRLRESFIERTVKGLCEKGGIGVFHDTSQITTDSLEEIIKEIKNRGGVFKDIDHILSTHQKRFSSVDVLSSSYTHSLGVCASSNKEQKSPVETLSKQVMTAVESEYPVHVGSYTNLEGAKRLLAEQEGECALFPFLREDGTLFYRLRCQERVPQSSQDGPTYSVQVGAFKVKDNAEQSRAESILERGSRCKIFKENDFYKVRCVE